MDLDLRKLRYFAAVAEHRHFGRAAELLYIAQPVLSRQIRSLEQDLGCNLFERTTRSVQLTPAGRLLQEEARRVFSIVDAVVRRVHEVDRGVERLVVAFAPGLHVSEIVRASRSRIPASRSSCFTYPGGNKMPHSATVGPTSDTSDVLSMRPDCEPSVSEAIPRWPVFPPPTRSPVEPRSA